MNLIRIFLSIYFVVLSIMPCNDIGNNLSSKDSFTNAIETEHSGSKTNDDICSPLCFCNCCQISITAFEFKSIVEFEKPISEFFSKKILFQKNIFAYQVYELIWQPPKI